MIILRRLYGLIRMWLEDNILFQSGSRAQEQVFQSEPDHTPCVIEPKKTLDEMSDWELRYTSGIPDVIRGSSHVDLDDLASRGFRKLNTLFLNYNLYGWPEVTIQALRLVALEKDCTLEKAFNTYKIFIETPKLSKGELNATIWVWQRHNPDDKDDKKEKLKKGIIETKVIKPKTMAATNGR